MSNTFFQGGEKFSRGSSPPCDPLVTDLVLIFARKQRMWKKVNVNEKKYYLNYTQAFCIFVKD